uniref:Inhibitor of growth protein n=1 Tax=Steinernema glaseri TaxID=37863 RepID=A0A1I8A9R4_9BILA
MVLLENFREVLDQLSPEVRERLQKLRSLDEEFEALKTHLTHETNAYFLQSKGLTPRDRRERRANIEREFGRLRALGKEKMSVTENVHQAIAKYNERLTKEFEDYRREMEADNPGVTEQIEARFRDTLGVNQGLPSKPKPVKRRVHSLCDEEEMKPRPATIVRKASLNIPIDGRMRTINMEKMLELRKRSMTIGGVGASDTKSFLQSLANAISKRRSSAALQSVLSVKDPSRPSEAPKTPKSPTVTTATSKQASPSSNNSRSSTTVVKSAESGSSGAPPTVVLACSESRHGRQRKPTSRVQELIVDGLQHRPGRLERAAQSSFGINLTAVQKELESEPPPKRSRNAAPKDNEDGEESEEKTWCICNECRIEWFHYHCVKISSPPTGVWLCPECTKAKEAGTIVFQKKESNKASNKGPNKAQPRG